MAGTKPRLRQLQTASGVPRPGLQGAQKGELRLPVPRRRDQHPGPLPQAVVVRRRDAKRLAHSRLGLRQAPLPEAHDRQRAPGFGELRIARHRPLRPCLRGAEVARVGQHERGLNMRRAVLRSARDELMNDIHRFRRVALLQGPPRPRAQGFHVSGVQRQRAPQRRAGDGRAAAARLGDGQEPAQIGRTRPRTQAFDQQPAGLIDFAQVQEHLRQQIARGFVRRRLRQDEAQQPASTVEPLPAALDVRTAQQRIDKAHVALLRLAQCLIGQFQLAEFLLHDTQEVPGPGAIGMLADQVAGRPKGAIQVAGAEPVPSGLREHLGIFRPMLQRVGQCSFGLFLQSEAAQALRNMHAQTRLLGRACVECLDGFAIRIDALREQLQLLAHPPHLHQPLRRSSARQRVRGPTRGLLDAPEVVQGPRQRESRFVQGFVELASLLKRRSGGGHVAAALVQITGVPVQRRATGKPLARGQQHASRLVYLIGLQKEEAQRRVRLRRGGGQRAQLAGERQRAVQVARRKPLPGLLERVLFARAGVHAAHAN